MHQDKSRLLKDLQEIAQCKLFKKLQQVLKDNLLSPIINSICLQMQSNNLLKLLNLIKEECLQRSQVHLLLILFKKWSKLHRTIQKCGILILLILLNWRLIKFQKDTLQFRIEISMYFRIHLMPYNIKTTPFKHLWTLLIKHNKRIRLEKILLCNRWKSKSKNLSRSKGTNNINTEMRIFNLKWWLFRSSWKLSLLVPTGPHLLFKLHSR